MTNYLFDIFFQIVYSITMNKTLANIKALYDKMGSSEKKIADFLFKNPSALLPLSISELAEASGSSEATIVRFSRRLGFAGYQQLKLSLARDGNLSEVSTFLSPDDPPRKVFEKVCDDIYCSLMKTLKLIDDKTFREACEAILSADRIVVFGLGNSASVAMDMTHKLLRLGYDAVSYSDNHMQAIAAAHLTQKCVAVGISHSGSSRDIIDALKIAKNAGAKTVALTNTGKSPIFGVADYVLSTVSDEINYSILGLNSRISQLAIIDTIYYYAVCHSQNAQAEIDKTEQSLLTKKF